MLRKGTSGFRCTPSLQPSSANTLASTPNCKVHTKYVMGSPEHNSERAKFHEMEGWEADATVFRFSYRHEGGGRVTSYRFSRGDKDLPGNTYQVLADALNLSELLRLELQEKLETIDFRDADHHRRLQASSGGNFDIDIFCKVEITTKGGMDRIGALWILRDVIRAVNVCAKEHSSKWNTSSEERSRVGVFRAGKSIVWALNKCDDMSASIFFPIRGTKCSTGLKDLMERLANVDSVQEVRCFVHSEPRSEPQGVMLWLGEASIGKTE
ncbi:hypothetical protein KC345_g7865 [Hortaea werneckii]|nr:hypothetical protein KC345_g7865 [Hortaea werneckii]